MNEIKIKFKKKMPRDMMKYYGELIYELFRDEKEEVEISFEVEAKKK